MRDMEITATGEGRYLGIVRGGWESQVGINGGYLSAFALHALQCELSGITQNVRSLSVHFANPASCGQILITTGIEYSGSRITSAYARIVQESRPILTAICTFTSDFEAPEFSETEMPDVARPGDCDVLPPLRGMLPTFFERFEYRPCLGAPAFSGAAESSTATWVRPRDFAITDESLLLTVMSDCWLPAMFTRLTGPTAVATLSINMQFRRPKESAAPGDGAYRLIAARSLLSRSGLSDQSVGIWHEDGSLLAQAHHLCALLRSRSKPPKPPEPPQQPEQPEPSLLELRASS